MTEKSINWFYLALMMWGAETKYNFFYTKMWDIKFHVKILTTTEVKNVEGGGGEGRKNYPLNSEYG